MNQQAPGTPLLTRTCCSSGRFAYGNSGNKPDDEANLDDCEPVCVSILGGAYVWTNANLLLTIVPVGDRTELVSSSKWLLRPRLHALLFKMIAPAILGNSVSTAI